MSAIEPQLQDDIVLDPCEGCGITFPLRQGTGECPKCVKLAEHKIDSPDYNELQVSSNFSASFQSILIGKIY